MNKHWQRHNRPKYWECFAFTLNWVALTQSTTINLASNFIFTIKQFQDIQGLSDNSASLTISSEYQNLSPVPIECLTLAHGDDLDQANPYGIRWLNNSEDNKKSELLIMNQLWNVEKYLPGTNWSESSAAMFWKGLQGGQIDRQVSFQNHFPPSLYSLIWDRDLSRA